MDDLAYIKAALELVTDIATKMRCPWATKKPKRADGTYCECVVCRATRVLRSRA